jgi:hypothetical protein
VRVRDAPQARAVLAASATATRSAACTARPCTAAADSSAARRRARSGRTAVGAATRALDPFRAGNAVIREVCGPLSGLPTDGVAARCA